jgi:hypothetical protein
MALYRITTVAITNVGWTAIAVPADCLYAFACSVRCDTDGVLIRTNQGDSTTQDSLALGEQEFIPAQNEPWQAGTTVVYVMAQTQANANLKVKFSR